MKPPQPGFISSRGLISRLPELRNSAQEKEKKMPMTESGSGKSQFDIDSLRETLCTQQKLLQKLYNELDAEREASSTSASETLSMILRLQGEKATMKMELEQYKRLAEEKMNHAEESLAIFEDLMYQKEMEVTAMDYQVQAYRYKLLSVGCTDPGIGEIKFPDTLLQRNETLGGDISLEGLGRRNSAPSLALKLSLAKKAGAERDSLSPETKISEDCTYQDINDPSLDFEKKTDSSSIGCLNSYWEEIKKLDGRVKEIAGVSYVNTRSCTRSPSPQPQLSSDSSYDLTKGAIVNEVDIVKHPDSGCSPSVMDVFEVPPVNCNNADSSQSQTKYSNKLQHPTCVLEENVKSFLKDECDLWKKRTSSSICEKGFCRPIDGGGIQCNMALIRPSRLQVNLGSEIVEVESQTARQECEAKKEEIKLLNEIREQLNSIQSQIRGLKTKQPERRDDTDLVMLAEDMLHFWL